VETVANVEPMSGRVCGGTARRCQQAVWYRIAYFFSGASEPLAMAPPNGGRTGVLLIPADYDGDRDVDRMTSAVFRSVWAWTPWIAGRST
jgi:hypothetical protein